MEEERFQVTPRQEALLCTCLTSKLCIKIFKVLSAERTLNISAISRKAGCTGSDGKKYLSFLAELGVVEEKNYPGLHMYSIKEVGLTRLIRQTIAVMEQDPRLIRRRSIPLSVKRGFSKFSGF